MRETRASGLSAAAIPLGSSTKSSRQSGAISMAQTCLTLDVPVRAFVAMTDEEALQRQGAREQMPIAKRCAS
eukprot:scaffold267487_cov30-Tisochrysis_lutea.AAC.1